MTRGLGTSINFIKQAPPPHPAIHRTPKPPRPSCKASIQPTDPVLDEDGCYEEVDIVTQEIHLVCPVVYDELSDEEGAWKTYKSVGFGFNTGFPIPTGYAADPLSRAISRRKNRSSSSSSDDEDISSSRVPTPAPYRAKHWIGPRTSSLQPSSSSSSSLVVERNVEGFSNTETTTTYKGPVRPVFRASPFAAEQKKKQKQSPLARILVLDEGNISRSILAEAVIKKALKQLDQPLNVEVVSKSIGTPNPPPHDARVVEIAEYYRLRLARRESSKFVEVSDAVEYDLILVMDQFDKTDVLREVSILEKINPQGNYCSKVKLFGSFCGGISSSNGCHMNDDFEIEDGSNHIRGGGREGGFSSLVPDIGDPLWCPAGDDEEAGFHRCIQQLDNASQGLINMLLLLEKSKGSLTLQQALSQSLQCPLLVGGPPPKYIKGAVSLSQWQPIWFEAGADNNNNKNKVLMKNDMTSKMNDTNNNNDNDNDTNKLSGSYDDLPEHQNMSISTSTDGEFFTIKLVSGEQHVVKKSSLTKQGSWGYWTHIPNIDAEIQEFMQRYNIEDRLPTQVELKTGGGNALCVAIGKAGGLGVFSERLGLPFKTRKPNGYWDTFSNLSDEIRCFMEGDGNGDDDDDDDESNSDDNKRKTKKRREKFPTQVELTKGGRQDLIRAIRVHGGSAAVASKMGLSSSRRPLPTIQAVEQELSHIATTRCNGQCMPSADDLKLIGKTGLVRDIKRLGGFRFFAGKMNLPLCSMCAVDILLHDHDEIVGSGGGDGGGKRKEDEKSMDLITPGGLMLNNNNNNNKTRTGRRQGQRNIVLDLSSTPISHRNDSSSSSSDEEYLDDNYSSHPASPSSANNNKDSLIARVSTKLVSIINSEGWPHHKVPPRAALLAAGRGDLHLAIQRCGGARRVAEYLGWDHVETRGRRRPGEVGWSRTAGPYFSNKTKKNDDEEKKASSGRGEEGKATATTTSPAAASDGSNVYTEFILV